jgi:hypothetical protein
VLRLRFRLACRHHEVCRHLGGSLPRRRPEQAVHLFESINDGGPHRTAADPARPALCGGFPARSHGGPQRSDAGRITAPWCRWQGITGGKSETRPAVCAQWPPRWRTSALRGSLPSLCSLATRRAGLAGCAAPRLRAAAVVERSLTAASAPQVNAACLGPCRCFGTSRRNDHSAASRRRRRHARQALRASAS